MWPTAMLAVANSCKRPEAERWLAASAHGKVVGGRCIEKVTSMPFHRVEVRRGCMISSSST